MILISFFYTSLAIIMIVLIFKRVKDKKKEEFEKRDN